MSTTPKPDRLTELLEHLAMRSSDDYRDSDVKEAHAAITALMGEVIGPNTGLFEGHFSNSVRNELRNEQRQRLTALTALTAPDKAPGRDNK